MTSTNIIILNIIVQVNYTQLPFVPSSSRMKPMASFNVERACGLLSLSNNEKLSMSSAMLSLLIGTKNICTVEGWVLAANTTLKLDNAV